MTNPGSVLDRFGVVGFNHQQLPARLRGVLASDDSWSRKLADQLKRARVVDGFAFVSTCNRQEIVVSADHPAFAIELIRAQLHSILEPVSSALPEPFRHTGAEAVRHVLRVSASLDSLVVGERQITQQLRRAFDRARAAGWLDKYLNGLVRIAVENAKEIHQRTAIGAESVGVFTLAREIVARETSAIARPKVAVVGLGEIGLLTARAFVPDHRFDLVLSSRRARNKGEVGVLLENAPFRPLADLDALLREMDAIVLATGSNAPVIDEAIVQRARAGQTRPLVLVDIGIPPQADAVVDGLENVRLFNLDWFTTTGFGQRKEGREALRQAANIVEEGVRRVAEWASIRQFSGLFDSCDALTEEYKARMIPDIMKQEMPGLTPELQRQVYSSMHRLLTTYSESVYQMLSRELTHYEEPAIEQAVPAVPVEAAQT